MESAEKLLQCRRSEGELEAYTNAHKATRETIIQFGPRLVWTKIIAPCIKIELQLYYYGLGFDYIIKICMPEYKLSEHLDSVVLYNKVVEQRL